MASDNQPDEPQRRPSTPPPPRKGTRAAKKAKSAKSGKGSQKPSSGPARNRRAAVAEERKRRQTLLALGATGVVIVVIAVFVIIKVSGGGKSADSSTLSGKGVAAAGAGVGTPVPQFVYSGFAAVKPATLASAAKNASVSDLTDPKVTNDPAISTPKPTVLYIGAEYCPYCATERWAITMALSQFGTFSHLTDIRSSAHDSSGFDSVPTFAFYKSTYTSSYLTFESVEEYTVSEKVLQTPTKAETAITDKYDTSDSIPFVYLNGKAIIEGAEYDPKLLLNGDFTEDAKSIIGGTSSLATAVYADAGAIVSDLCRMTDGKPGSVCKDFPKPITR